jgi:hypothetical protein
MKISKQISTIGIGLVLLAAPAFAQESDTIRPNTPQATLAMAELRSMEASDRGNAQSFTDDNNSLDHYYARKARRVARVLQKMEQGQPVTESELDEALDTSGAAKYGPRGY